MAIESHPQVIVYTTPTCPDCRTLKAWLDRAGIAFEERDLTDPKIMAEAKVRSGVRVAPITLVGEKVFYGTFLSQKPGLTEALGLYMAPERDVFLTPGEASARGQAPTFQIDDSLRRNER